MRTGSAVLCIVTALAADGIRAARVEVDYRFQRGEPFMLVCHR
jgi:hypothetical protein